MVLRPLGSLLRRLASQGQPLLLYAAAWTALLTVAVGVASFSPEIAFASAISPSSSFAAACGADAAVRVPLDFPGEIVCLPAELFRRSKIDLVVPPVFAAVVVGGAACVVRALGLWEAEESPLVS